MLLLALPAEFLGWCLFGLGAIVLGGLGLLGRWTRWLLLGLGPVLALASAGLALADGPAWGWLATLGLALLAALLGLSRSGLAEGVGRRFFSLVRVPLVQGAVLLAAGLCVCGWQVVRLSEDPTDLAINPILELEQQVDLTPAAGVGAVTDEGSPVPIFAARTLGEVLTAEREMELLRNMHLESQVIQQAAPSLDCNCHGWVFAGGRHWVRGAAVEGILHDNRYKKVSTPRPGDVAVYRDTKGEVKHTGLVKVAGDGMVLIESKWGQRARYLHSPEQGPYQNYPCTFYHTDRGSHLLRGLGTDNAGTAPAAPVSVGRVPRGT